MCKVNCGNCYMNKLLLVNKTSGELFRPHCKTYTCPTHGWKRKKDLIRGIIKWLKQFEFVRFLTFTAKFPEGSDPHKHNKLFQRAWHRFITELRRNKMLTKKEQDVQYIKVYEFHKSGALHIHAFFSQFIHWSKLQALWQFSLQATLGGEGKLGNVYIKGIKNPEQCAHYVAKYVVKMAHDMRMRIRAWSKSGKVAIFEYKKSTGDWVMVTEGTDLYRFAWQGLPILEIGISNVTNDVEHLRKLGKPALSLFKELTKNQYLKYEYTIPDDKNTYFMSDDDKNKYNGNTTVIQTNLKA